MEKNLFTFLMQYPYDTIEQKTFTNIKVQFDFYKVLMFRMKTISDTIIVFDNNVDIAQQDSQIALYCTSSDYNKRKLL